MISLELAKRLKELGLEWEPKFGDHYIIPAVFEEGLHEVMDTKQVMSYHKNPKEWEESIRGFIFTPRLDQLLAEIEGRGYWWSIENGLAEYLCFFVKQDGKKFIKQSFWANSPEEATAQALIWILEQEQATE